MQQFRVYAGETKVDIDFSRFNYALVYLRLLEELQHRRFDLPKFPVEDPAWEVAAQRWRTNFAKMLYAYHQDFYNNTPEALVCLKSLTEIPTHYDN